MDWGECGLGRCAIVGRIPYWGCKSNLCVGGSGRGRCVQFNWGGSGANVDWGGESCFPVDSGGAGRTLGDADNGRFANHPLQVQENSAISVFLLCATIHGLLYLLKYHSVCSVIVLMS